MKKGLLQFVRFIGISGVGWLIDLSLYLLFTSVFHWEVFYSNCLSALPAVTLVFFVSTSKIFRRVKGKIPIHVKYAIYVIYQLLLLLVVSLIGQWLAGWIVQMCKNVPVLVKLSKIIAKIFITPITMIANFFVVKILTEKL